MKVHTLTLDDFSLATLGEGGFGFYACSFPSDLLHEEFSFEFEWPSYFSRSIMLRGKFVYQEPAPSKQNPNLLFVGVEFIPESRVIIRPLIEQFEKLAGQRQICRTSFVRKKEPQR